MNYHTPTAIVRHEVPQFAELNDEIICPQKVFSKQEYPNLPFDMVKITGRDGRNIYINRAKLNISSMDA